MKSTNKNLLLWEQWIKERIQNKLSVDEWCLKNGITKHQYYYWNKKIRENQKADNGVIFADVTANLSIPGNIRKKSTALSDFQIFIKDICVTVPSDFNPESFAGLRRGS